MPRSSFPFASSKALLFTLLLSFGAAPRLSAQNPFAGEDLLFGWGGIYEQKLDHFYSPRLYHGYSGWASAGWRSQSQRWQSNLRLSGGFGQLYNQGSGQFRRHQNIPAQLHYSLRYCLGRASGQAFFLGLSNQITWNYHVMAGYGNSSESFAGFFSYGLSAAWQAWVWAPSFLPKGRLAWESQLELPLGSYALRPGFVSQSIADEFGLEEHVFWDRFFHLHSRHSLIWWLKNGNSLRLQYAWDYTSLQAINSWYQGRHEISLILFLRLK